MTWQEQSRWQDWHDRHPMSPWHMRGAISRAYIEPGGFWRRVYLYLRGWRPHWIGPLWQKQGPQRRKR